MEISDIREKFFPIFRPENIDNITAEDFKSFFSTDVKEFFATRDSNLEHMYSGIVTKGTNFDDVKIMPKKFTNLKKSLSRHLNSQQHKKNVADIKEVLLKV